MIGLPFRPEVAREGDRHLAARAVARVGVGHRRAEDVPRVVELDLDPVAYGHGAVVRHRDELARRLDHVLLVVERLPFELGAPLGRLLAQVLRVAGLDGRRVHHHHARQVARRRRRVDVAAIAALGQERQHAAVVEVRVREDHRRDRLGVGHEGAVLLLGLLAPALEGPAVDQATRPVDAQDVLGAGDFAGPSLGMEAYAHGSQ